MSTFVACGAVDPDDGKGHLRRGAASRPMLPTPGARENTFATVTDVENYLHQPNAPTLRGRLW